MQPGFVEAVADSFARVSAEGLCSRVYEILFQADEGIRRRLDPVGPARRREFLLHGIRVLIDAALGGSAGSAELRRLTALHGPGALDVPEGMLRRWADAVVEALSEHDPQWSDRLEGAWHRVLGSGVAALADPITAEPGDPSVDVHLVDGTEVRAVFTSGCGARHFVRWAARPPGAAAALKVAVERAGPDALTLEDLLARVEQPPLVVVSLGPRCAHCPLGACPPSERAG